MSWVSECCSWVIEYGVSEFLSVLYEEVLVSVVDGLVNVVVGIVSVVIGTVSVVIG